VNGRDCPILRLRSGWAFPPYGGEATIYSRQRYALSMLFPGPACSSEMQRQTVGIARGGLSLRREATIGDPHSLRSLDHSFSGKPKRAWLSGKRMIRPSGRTIDRRRGRDSNPRYPCGYICFRDRPIRPLWHLSERGGKYRRLDHAARTRMKAVRHLAAQHEP
jgi:hypothetical protein